MSFSFLKRSKIVSIPTTKTVPKLVVDMHTHILPAIDNGPHTIEESISILKKMAADGVKKVITTPHIMADYYNSTPHQIRCTYEQLLHEVRKYAIPIKIEIGAEYYLDDSFVQMVRDEQPLMLLKNNYLLLETGLFNMPSNFWEILEKLTRRNITVILAHPERYHYLQQNFSLVEHLHNSQVLFQINLNSGVSPHVGTRTLTERMITAGIVSFVASNTHSLQEWNLAKEQVNTNLFADLWEEGLKNSIL